MRVIGPLPRFFVEILSITFFLSVIYFLFDTTENFSASLPIPIGLNPVSKIVSYNISGTPFSSVFFGIIGLSATSIDINGGENY